MGETPGHRMFASSHDGGLTLGGFGIDNTLVTPITKDWTGIVASVHAVLEDTFRVKTDPNPRLMLTLPANATVRANLSIYTSVDSGSSWQFSSTFNSGLGGYTDLVATSHGMGVIFENGVQTFSDKISFVHLRV